MCRGVSPKRLTLVTLRQCAGFLLSGLPDYREPTNFKEVLLQILGHNGGVPLGGNPEWLARVGPFRRGTCAKSAQLGR